MELISIPIGEHPRNKYPTDPIFVNPMRIDFVCEDVKTRKAIVVVNGERHITTVDVKYVVEEFRKCAN